jgi:TIR domain
MRVLILGSSNILSDEQKKEFETFCFKLGIELASYDIDLLLCSPFNDSADKLVFDGVFSPINKYEIAANIELHYPTDEVTVSKWAEILGDKTNIKHFKHPHESNIKENLKFSWLYCQMQALENADVVFVIGGKIDGSANLLLRMAEAQDKNVIPIYAFEGQGLHFYRRNYYKLFDSWGEDLTLFGEKSKQELLVKTILEGPIIRKKPRDKNIDPVFFLSYPRARPHEADFVEMQLRRRGYTVIRDENDINESTDITNAIQENINKADVFISLWCKEYACSPWCFDELSIAVHKKNKDKYSIWILCLDDTRIVHPEARNLLHFKVKSREEIEGRISLLLEKYRK